MFLSPIHINQGEKYINPSAIYIKSGEKYINHSLKYIFLRGIYVEEGEIQAPFGAFCLYRAALCPRNFHTLHAATRKFKPDKTCVVAQTGQK